MWSFFVFLLCLFVALTGCSNVVSVKTECNQPSLEDKIIAQDKRKKIRDYLNRGIRIHDNFAGQGIMLIKEDGDYFVLREIFGSGFPVIGSIKYKAVFYSDWQIRFSETTDDSDSECEEYFILEVDNEGLKLFLNGLQVVIEEPSLEETNNGS